MRLKAEKVEYLSRKIAAAFKKLNKLEFKAPAETVEGAIKRIIQADLRREDDLEKEAEAVLSQYKMKISMQNMSYNTLLTRTKQQLARKKKIIL